MSTSRYELAFERCPVHKNFACISLNEVDGGGVRLTPGKCCGQWAVVWSRRMNADDLRKAAEVFSNASEES